MFGEPSFYFMAALSVQKLDTASAQASTPSDKKYDTAVLQGLRDRFDEQTYTVAYLARSLPRFTQVSSYEGSPLVFPSLIALRGLMSPTDLGLG
jgi:hypothetical protein